MDTTMETKARNRPIGSSYLLKFSSDKDSELDISAIVQELKSSSSFIVWPEVQTRGLYRVSCRRLYIERLAEIEGLLKRTTTGSLEPFVMPDSDTGVLRFWAYTDRFFSPSEELWLLRRLLEQFKRGANNPHTCRSSFVRSLQISGHLLDMWPDHTCEKLVVWKTVLFHPPFSISDQCATIHAFDTLEAYYGPKIAMYFAWLSHFSQWLVLPGVVGSILSRFTGPSSHSLSIFSLLMLLWAAAFLQCWKRKCATLCCHWGLSQDSIDESQNPNFNMKKKEEEEGLALRMLRCGISALVNLGMLTTAFVIMILSLNIQGCINPSHVYLYLPTLSRWGHTLEVAGVGFVPSFVHYGLISWLNGIYRILATKLNDFEHHHDNDEAAAGSLIVKRFVFEAFDCYIGLFYLAFGQPDLSLLRQELQSLYMYDSFRRLTLESLVPLFVQKFWKCPPRTQSGTTQSKSGTNSTSQQLLYDMQQAPYDAFEDYMEMVIEFGYILLFAGVFPLAAALSLVNNVIEMKSDLFKLTFVVRRPDVVRARHIGTWIRVLEALVYCSVVSNVFLFGFATTHMDEAWVSFMSSSSSKYGQWKVGLVFALEHVLMLLVKFIFTAIPDIPPDVQKENARRTWQWKARMTASMKPSKADSLDSSPAA